jgi:hypothetical protein
VVFAAIAAFLHVPCLSHLLLDGAKMSKRDFLIARGIVVMSMSKGWGWCLAGFVLN